MLSRLYRCWLTAAGYRPIEPQPTVRHQLADRHHARHVLQQRIHRHAEVERQRRLSQREQEVRERLDGIVEGIYVLVDRRGYEAGLW